MDSGILYSTETGRMCPDCGKPIDSCICREIRKNSVPEGDGIVRVSRETKGRKGKGVTLIKGILLPEDELRDLGKKLKQRCGTGGTVKDGVIEIQGDNRDTVIEYLKGMNYIVKRVGG